MTNEMVGWGLGVIAFLFFAWSLWPKKKVTEVLEEVKKEEPTVAAAPVAEPVKKTAPAKKAPVKKAPAKKAPAKKAPVKKVAKKGRK
jgi:hypothetical protein